MFVSCPADDLGNNQSGAKKIIFDQIILSLHRNYIYDLYRSIKKRKILEDICPVECNKLIRAVDRNHYFQRWPGPKE